MLDQTLVREGGLWIVVSPTQPGVAGHGIQIPPVLLDVLAVIALGTGQPEHPLLQDRIRTVPQGQAEAKVMPDIRDPGHAVLVPPVCPRTGMVVRERIPRVAIGAVILPDRAPRPFGQV